MANPALDTWVTKPNKTMLHANDNGRMNKYIGNENRQQAKDRHRGNQFLNYMEMSFTSCVEEKEPGSYVPKHPKRQLPSSLRIRYGAWS